MPGPPAKVPSRRASLDQEVSAKVPNRRASLDQQALSKAATKRNTSPRVSVWNNSTVSSLGKQVIRKEGDVAKSRLRKVSSRNSTNDEVKKSATNGKAVEAMAANLPLDSLCLCLEKLQSVYHIVSCASVCRHWRDAVLSDVVS